MKGKSSIEKRKRMHHSLERRGGNLRVNLFPTPQKKRKRNDNLQKETFIMKVFDRSLDLFKYTESTSLYPIVRAWMLNQPRNPSILSYRELEKSLEELEGQKVKRENNGEEMLRRITKNDGLVITVLPAPLNIEVPEKPKMNKNTKPDLEALDELLKHKEGDSDTTEDATNAEEKRAALLSDYKKKWINIKRDCIKNARCADKRYELNKLIIAKLYKP